MPQRGISRLKSILRGQHAVVPQSQIVANNPRPNRYHWALIIGSKDEVKNDQGKRYHAKENIVGQGRSEWAYEERTISIKSSNMLLVRILIGKVTDLDRTVNILRSTPIRQNLATWNCVTWVQEALEALRADPKALGTSVVEWQKVRNAAMEYCQKKKDQHRFDGQGNFDMSKAATYDLIEGKETIP